MYLSAKINKPSYVSAIIDRPHLYSQLDCWQEHRGIIIHAPAGYGKSTLVSRWIDVSDLSGHAAWFSLEKEDGDPRQFIYTLTGALDRCLPGVLAAMQPVLEDRHGSQQRALGRLFTILEDGTLSGARPADHHLLLVLDDLQRVASPEVDSLIQTVLEFGPEKLHLIMLSRRRTELALARLYARGLIQVLTKEDLRFTKREVQSYLLAHGFSMPNAAEVNELTSRSEGWISALHLAVLSLRERGSVPELLDALKGEREWLAAFLTDEVLKRREPALRLFMMQTSILDEFNAELCAAVTSSHDARAQLATIASADLFLIQLDKEGGWYRYHHLFQELLQQRLAARFDASAVLDMHRRAAAWLTSAGHIFSAIRHLLAAGAEEEAVELVESRLHQTLTHDPLETKRLFDLLPPRLWQQRPRLLIDRCTLAMLLDDAQITEYVQQAAVIMEEQGLISRTTPATQGEWLVLRAAACLITNDLEGMSNYLGQALVYAGDLDDFYTGTLAFVELFLQNKKGEHAKMREIADRAVAAFERADFLSGTFAVRRQLGRWAMQRGDNQEATRYFRALLDNPPRGRAEIVFDLCWAYVFAAENSYWQNDLQQSRTYQRAALALAQQLHDERTINCCNLMGAIYQSDSPETISPNLLLRTEQDLSVSGSLLALQIKLVIRYLTNVGLAEKAWLIAQKTDLDLADIPTVYAHPLLTSYLQAAIAYGVDLDALTSLIKGAIVYHAEIGQRFRQLQLVALQACQQLQLYGTERATATLAEAVCLARETGYVRVLLEIPELSELLDTDLEIRPPSTRQDQNKINLTERERQILELLMSDRTYQQIGDELSITINTVRTHVRHLYRKLSVKKRSQAIMAAQQHGLLSDDATTAW